MRSNARDSRFGSPFNGINRFTVVAQVTFDPNSWLLGEAGNLLSSAIANEDGVIVISPDQNPDIYDIIEDAIDNTSEVEIEMKF